MSHDETLLQSDTAQSKAQQLSRLESKPQLAGYELQLRLGSGSFGEVWAGLQKSTGQPVAVKFFVDRSQGDLGYIRRELERLREVSDHFAVVGLIDADLDHDPPYFVMPLLARSLAQQIGRPSAAQAIVWLRQLASGLQHSHDKGLLHCDLKPSNVMLDESGAARLVDFGQSRQQGDGVVAWGTLGYMAPEQAQLGTEAVHSSPNVRWDVYGLGATFYRLLTGSYPYWTDAALAELAGYPLAERLQRYRQHILQSRLVGLRRLNPQVDGDLADLIQACLQARPELRPANMADLLHDLDRRQRGQPLLCRRPWSPSYRLGKWARRPALVVATLATLGLVTGGALSYSRLSAANQQQKHMLTRLMSQQAVQLQQAKQWEEAGQWWAQARDNDPQDPILPLRLIERFGLETEYKGAGVSLDGDVLLSDEGAFLWEDHSFRRLDLPAGFAAMHAVAGGRWLALWGVVVPQGRRPAALIYDLQQRRVVAPDLKLTAYEDQLAWNDQGQLVALEDGCRTVCWSADGKEIGRRQLGKPQESARLSPDGAWALLGNRLVEMSTGESRPLQAEGFSTRGNWLVAGSQILSLRGEKPWKLARPGRFGCFVGEDRVAIVRDARVTLEARDDTSVDLEFKVQASQLTASPDGRFLLTQDETEHFYLWDCADGRLLATKKFPARDRVLSFSADSHSFFATDGALAKAWKLDPVQPAWTALAGQEVEGLAWGPRQQWFLATTRQGFARLNDQGKVLQQESWPEPMRSCALSNQGRWAAELQGSLRLFSEQGSQQLASYAAGHIEERCTRVAFSRDGSCLLASLPGKLKLWRVHDDAAIELGEIPLNEEPHALGISPDGRYAAALCATPGSAELQLRVWSVTDLQQQASARYASDSPPTELAFGPDWLLVRAGGSYATLGVPGFKELAHWKLDQREDAPLALADGLAVTWTEQGVQRLSLPSGTLLGEPWQASSTVTSLSLSPNQRLALVSTVLDSALLDEQLDCELRPTLGTANLTCVLFGEHRLIVAPQDGGISSYLDIVP